MEPLKVDIPTSLKQFVDERVSSGGYGDIGAYIRSLIEADQRRAAKEWLEGEMIKGLDSGDPVPLTAEVWQSIRDEVLSRHAARDAGGESCR